MKKSGKTFLAGALVIWWAFVTSDSEVINAANDLDQSVGRVFKTVVQILKHNPTLMQSAKILGESIQLSNGTTITAIASDYKGAAGSRHSLVVYDELWGFSLEKAERLFEELTPPPTEPNAWVLIVTYAGWVGESVLLERLYNRGLAGERIDDDLELYRADDLVMFWSETPRQPWQTQKYYDSQRQILRPSTFARLHENKWVSSESTFITPALWDANVDESHHPLLPDPSRRDFGGIDIGIKNDNAAAHLVTSLNNRVVQVTHRIWKPTATSPLNIEETVEAFVLDWHARGDVQWLVDPYQAHQMITRLKAAGVRIEEFPQTVANTVRMGQSIYDLLNARGLRLYPDDEVRQQALNAVAVENPRGFRIAKEKASRKIDAIVALSMACVGLLDRPAMAPLSFSSGGVRIGATTGAVPVPVCSEPARPKGRELLGVPQMAVKFLEVEEQQERAALLAEEGRRDSVVERGCRQHGYWWPRT
jgi:phage terminase large subunit-like protein